MILCNFEVIIENNGDFLQWPQAKSNHHNTEFVWSILKYASKFFSLTKSRFFRQMHCLNKWDILSCFSIQYIYLCFVVRVDYKERKDFPRFAWTEYWKISISLFSLSITFWPFELAKNCLRAAQFFTLFQLVFQSLLYTVRILWAYLYI